MLIPNKDWLAHICWNKERSQKACTFLWNVVQNKIISVDHLNQLGIIGPSKYVIYGCHEEMVNHLLVNYVFSSKFGNHWVGLVIAFFTSWLKLKKGKLFLCFLKISPSILMWEIWKEHTKFIFQNRSMNVQSFVNNLKNTIVEVGTNKGLCLIGKYFLLGAK